MFQTRACCPHRPMRVVSRTSWSLSVRCAFVKWPGAAPVSPPNINEFSLIKYHHWSVLYSEFFLGETADRKMKWDVGIALLFAGLSAVCAAPSEKNSEDFEFVEVRWQLWWWLVWWWWWVKERWVNLTTGECGDRSWGWGQWWVMNVVTVMVTASILSWPLACQLLFDRVTHSSLHIYSI